LKAGVEAGDLAEPAVELGDAVVEVVDDLDQSWPRRGSSRRLGQRMQASLN
jgi:hypothetical protein